ncbi:MAG: hypothetical protein NZN45_00960 [Rhodovarius sp.]|nr:hypothetical protein [Rhodovarius sp.]
MRRADPTDPHLARRIAGQRVELWAIGCLAAAAWLAARPYGGVRHDAIFYLALALARPEPSRFAQDLFFLYGSQDRFSLFTSLYAPLVQALGWAAAHPLMLAAGQVLWLGGLWLLMRALFAQPLGAWLGCLGAALLPAAYGPAGLLGYGEPFVTPRLFAEAMGLLALALGLRGRWILAFVAALAAGSLHPIMAMPILGLLGLLLLWGRWALVGALALAGGALLLAVSLGAVPEVGLLRRMDEEWLGILAARSGFHFPTLWQWQDWARFAAMILAGGIAALLARGPRRRLVLAALAIAVGGMALAVLGGDLAGIQAVVAGQAWRWSWVAAVIVHAVLIAELLAPLARAAEQAQPPLRPAHVLALVALMLLADLLEAMLPALLAILAGLLWHVGKGSRSRLPDLLLWVSVPISLAAGLVLAALAAHGLMQGNATFALMICASLVLRLGACALALRLLQANAPRPGAAWLIASIFLLFFSCAVLDRRSDWNRFLERLEAAEVESFLATDGPVLWDGGLEILWFVARRGNHFSSTQAAGLAFHRETALAFRQRQRDFPFVALDRPPFDNTQPVAPPPSPEALREACRRHPELAVMILPHELPGLASGAWTLPVRHPRLEGTQSITFHRYDCAALRDSGAAAQGAGARRQRPLQG